VSLAALVVSVFAALVSLGSLVYVRRADRRATTSDRRAVLERVGSIMREAATLQAATLTDPMASSRLHAARARLTTAIDETGVDLPKGREYAASVDPSVLAEAERELERAIAAAGRRPQGGS
jgi:hypothetical protein